MSELWDTTDEAIVRHKMEIDRGPDWVYGIGLMIVLAGLVFGFYLMWVK